MTADHQVSVQEIALYPYCAGSSPAAGTSYYRNLARLVFTKSQGKQDSGEREFVSDAVPVSLVGTAEQGSFIIMRGMEYGRHIGQD